MQSFIFGKGTGALTPEDLKRRRAFNEAVLANGSSTAPIQGGAMEAIARVLQAGIGGYFEGQDRRAANEQRTKASADYASGIADMLSGGSALAYSPTGPSGSSSSAPIAIGSDTSAAKDLKPVEREGYALAYLTKRGLSPHQAAGVVGNLIQESSLNTGARNPGDGADGSDSIGVGQWNGDRARNLRAFAAGNKRNAFDLDTQLDYVLHELDGSESAAGKALRAAKNVDEATAAMIGYERPAGWKANNPQGGHGWSNRIGHAQRLLGTLGSQSADAAPAASAPVAPQASAPLPDTRTSVMQAMNTVEQRQRPVEVASLDPSIGMDTALGYDPRRGMDVAPSRAASAPAAASAPVAAAGAPAPLPPPRTVEPNPTPPPVSAFSSDVQQAAAADPQFDGFARNGAVSQVAGALMGAPSQPGVPNGAAPVAGSSGGGSIERLVGLLSNPWLDEGQRSVVGSLVQRQLAQNAPLTASERLAAERFQYEKDKDGRTTWQKLDDDTLFDPRTGETRSITGPTGAVPKDLGLNPQYGVDANGNPVLLQLGKDGKTVQSQMPEGVTLSKEPIKLDAGTHFVLLDPITRQPIGQIPKDIAGEEAAKVRGKTGAEREVSASGDAQSAQNALDLIADIRNDPYRQRGTGMSSYGNMIPGTGGYDFQGKVDQAKSGAFLTAIQQMKGMGALSNNEGQAATAAITRMDTAASEEGFLKALDDYETIVRQALARAQRNLPAGTPQPAPADAPASSSAPVEGWQELPGGVRMRVKP